MFPNSAPANVVFFFLMAVVSVIRFLQTLSPFTSELFSCSARINFDDKFWNEVYSVSFKIRVELQKCFFSFYLDVA